MASTVWKVASGRETSRRFLLSNLTTASLLDGESGKKLVTCNAQQIVASLACSPENKHLVLSGEDGGVQVWGVASGELISTYPLYTCLVREIALRSPHPTTARPPPS